MIKKFILIALLPTVALAMQTNQKFVIGIENNADKEFLVKIYETKNKQLLFEKNIAPGEAIEKVFSGDYPEFVIGVYDGKKTVGGDRINVQSMNLPYFDEQKKESGLGFIITNPDGKVQVSKDLNYFMPAKQTSAPKTAIVRPLPTPPTAKPAPEVKPAPSAPYAGKYEIIGSNLSTTPTLRIELVSAKQGSVILDQLLDINKSFQRDFDANVFPLMLRVYEFRQGKEQKIFEDEIDLPAYKIPHFEFYVTAGIDQLKLGFSPNVAHGRQIAKPIQQQAQPQARPAPVTSASTTPSRQAQISDKYEIELQNGSSLPLRFRLVTKTGRKLFEGELPGKNPTERKDPKTPLYPVSAQDFPNYRLFI